MAASNLDASLAATVSTLDWEKVPDKLHCASCHKFNLNAYKATCCDGYICESCFNNARDVSCPVCDHKPFTSDVCKPNKAMRNTIKAYLKTVEKARAEERAKSSTAEDTPSQHIMAEDGVDHPDQEEEPPATATVVGEQPLAEVAEADRTPTVDIQPSIEDPDHDSADLDDDVDIQVELEDDHREISTQRMTNADETRADPSISTTEHKTNSQEPSNDPEGMSGMDFSNMMNGFNNMDYNQMMQMMAANGMTGFNPMMGMPMGMNPMSAGMFGGFGGPNGGINGMNMGMNFNPTQGMFSGWNNGQPNNNMWQNNNANAFSNGMGGDLGSNYGFNLAPNGNFQQSYPNGDFQSGYYGRGYGRGRGRGRGGFGRGRGNFHQYSQFQQQGHQNGFDQRQYDSQVSQSQTPETRPNEATGDPRSKTALMDTTHEDDEFAPGGQEEVLEALGDDYQKSTSDEKRAVEAVVVADDGSSQAKEPEKGDEDRDETQINDPGVDATASKELGDEAPGADRSKPIPEAYNEDLQGPMPPPSAPLGPSAQYGDHNGFRSRGQGRFPSRGRGMMSMSMSNGRPASPVKPHAQVPESKGVGVLGAPTGPRAMREPAVPARAASRSAGTGFQIMGRASMASQRSESRDFEPASSSKTPTREDDEARDRDQSRNPSKQDKYEHGRDDAEREAELVYRDKDTRHRRSKQDGHDDYDRETRRRSYSRSDSADRKSSRRSRGDKEKSSSSVKYHPSRARRYREEDANGDHEMDDYDESVPSNRDKHDGDSRSKHRSSKSSRYNERDRDRDRERQRERDRERDKDREKDRDRERDRDRDRDEKYRDRDHDRDRDRKRSRHDRHREDDKHHDYDYDHDHEHEADDQESRHRSRRHKRDHRRDADEVAPHASGSGSGSASAGNGNGNGNENGRSHRSSATTTAAAAPLQASKKSSAGSADAGKDPHTLEREARNRERMLKEQQRREKAAKANASGGGASGGGGGGSGSRRITYKYEDELERGLMEGERASARWR